MNLIAWVRAEYRMFFPKLVDEPKVEDLRKQSERNLVAAYARGNAGLQQGKYLTEQDAVELAKKVSAIKFL